MGYSLRPAYPGAENQCSCKQSNLTLGVQNQLFENSLNLYVLLVIHAFT